MVVNAWGEVLVELDGEWGGEPELGIFEVDGAMIERVRKEMPLLRRTDVYPEV
jgi:predicted amidohydrolase